MKIGILSDTHGKYDITVRAVSRLQSAGAEYLIHCGDVGNTAILDVISALPAAFVFGNNDYEEAEYRSAAEIVGVKCLGRFGELVLAGKRIAVTHGDDDRLVRRLTGPATQIDYLLTGHSHLRHDQRTAGARWVNPGALFRAPVKTVALLDLATDELTSLVIDEA